MPEVTWTVTAPSGEVKQTGGAKLPYFKPYTITDKMTAGQKDSAVKFNTMQQKLIELGEMESK